MLKKSALASAVMSMLLSACGGGGSVADAPVSLIESTPTVLAMEAPSEVQVAPTFQVSPVEFAEPEGEGSAPVIVGASTEPSGPRASAMRALVQPSAATGVTPSATTVVATVFSPAQIRAAYGLPALVTTNPTPAQAAAMGAGQTIYIVDAYHDPNAAAELAAFNTKFGLPGCTTKPATSPLAPASKTGCEFIVAYSSATGGMTSTVPAYNASWSTEIALDVQWAHATAPYARIVLIEAPDSGISSMSEAIRVANNMGPGAVSMSFGAIEGSWMTNFDTVFSGANMSYFAATGDSGAGVAWPSVHKNVIAVGGTTLAYDGVNARSETSWSGTGGGMSAYVAAPTYQTSMVPGMGTVARRMVADVAFNADPRTGQYTAVQNPGATVAKWMSVGGTSLSTPQWAGISAIVNATRVLNSKVALADMHPALYSQISTAPATYSSAFADISLGSDGTCVTCTAKVGYDQLSGLGTPNVSNLVTAMNSATTATTPVLPPAPVVNSQTVSGTAGTALTVTMTSTASNPVSYTMTGAPAGMTISTAGVIGWTAPVAGTYTVTVYAKDTVTALTGQGSVTVTIAAPVATGPKIVFNAVNGTAGTALSGSFQIVDPTSKSFGITITGVPVGMKFVVSGTNVSFTWAAPVKGSYSLNVKVLNTAKLTTTVVIPVTIK